MDKEQINTKILSISEDMRPVIAFGKLAAYLEIEEIEEICVDIMQRGACWTEEQIEKMYSDIVNSNNYEKHSLGLCLFHIINEKEEGGRKYRKMGLIDFNQRMQSMNFFLGVSEKIITDKGWTLNNYLEEIKNILYKPDGKIRFNVYEDDQKIFEELIITGETKQKIESKYNARLINNYNFIKQKLENLDEKQFYNFVDNLLHNIIFILGETKEDIFNCFENHNVYLVELSILEKIRNLTLSKFYDDTKRMSAKKRWDEIFKRIYIEGANMDEIEKKFFRNYMLSIGSGACTYNCFAKQIQNLNDNQILEKLEDIIESIGFYKIYVEGKINEFINGLSVLENEQGLPLFMLSLRMVKNKKMTGRQFERICELIFKLAFCYTFNGELPNKYGPIYKTAIKIILKEKIENKIEAAITFLKDKVNDRKYGALKEFREKVFYTKDDIKIATFILKKIEENNRIKPIVDDEMEIEHVLPKERLPEKWRELEKKEWFNDDVLYKVYAGKIGNLALLKRRDNSSLKEADFIDKKVVYMNYKETCILTYEISKEKEWNEVTIEERGKYLCNCLEEMWFK